MAYWLASYTFDTADLVSQIFTKIDLSLILSEVTWPIVVKIAFELALNGKLLLAQKLTNYTNMYITNALKGVKDSWIFIALLILTK